MDQNAVSMHDYSPETTKIKVLFRSGKAQDRRFWLPLRSLILLLFLCSPQGLGAEIQVILTPPRLNPGLAQLEALLGVEVLLAKERIQTLVNQALAKPLLMRAFADSGALSGAFHPRAPQGAGENLFVSLGFQAGAFAQTWDPDSLVREVSDFDPARDTFLGAALAPLVFDLGVAFDPLAPALRLRVSAGAWQAVVGEYSFSARSAAVFWAYGFFVPDGEASWLDWDGIEMEIGWTYSQNRIVTSLATGPITEAFTLDPDGAGPLPGQTVSVRIDPRFEVGLDSSSWAVPAGLSTGMTFFDTLSLRVGLSGSCNFGQTGISLSGAKEIEVLGYLANLQSSPGILSLSGTSDGAAPEIGQWFMTALVQLRIGTTIVNLPLAYRHPRGLAAGLSLGVVF